ncbi:alpha/beta hydrolase [Sphingobacteriaceae bacterium]|nr:alpha/beta hydrolase [Sphingobacteriaceae bacterium]
MPYVKTQGETPVELYYQDLGKGKPVIFIHGWPSNSCMWEYQLGELSKNFRCIAYDRRGFGMSEKPFDGYDYNTLASDLKSLIDHLNLSDVTLVGFSMGGGEVVRYLTNHGSGKVSKIVLVSAVTPFMLKTNDNSDGAPKEMFDEFEKTIKTDRPAFLSNFGKQFFGVNLVSHPVSDDLLQWAQGLTLQATQLSTLGCMRAFSETDFRKDCSAITVPTLIIHGDDDKTVPFETSGKKAAELIKNSTLKVYEGAPHGLFVTEKERLNQDLFSFISGAGTSVSDDKPTAMNGSHS